MKIAIVAPSPIPFTMGGAEKLWLGLVNYINKYTRHQCELIKIPIREDNFWNLIEAYYKFYKLDLSHFDLVISTKYPAWMVHHPNHYCYLQHCLRGLYDTYHLTGLPTEVETKDKKIKEILKLMQEDSLNLDDFFEVLFSLKDLKIDPPIFSFPGPFIRKIIHYLDKKSKEKIKKFFAISKTVKKRKDYFPPGKYVKVIYHPSFLDNFYCKKFDYFFTASRLDNAKRIDILIKAYLKSDTDIPLKIAGTGPLEEELKKLASNDSRIHFLGYVSDEELIDLYANSYAVIFIPYDEDYGLITIEAMKSKKPVLTFSDSGGVTEFVINDLTGYMASPSAENLKNLIEKVSSDVGKVQRVGENAYRLVQNISWENTIKSLLNGYFDVQIKRPKSISNKRILVLSTYSVFPPRGGGQNRVYFLCKELSKEFEVKILSLGHEKESFSVQKIAPNLEEIKVPKTEHHAHKEWLIQKKVGIPATDVAMSLLYKETPQYLLMMERFIEEGVDIIILEHPYCLPPLEEFSDKIKDKILVYDCHNVEFLLKKQMFQNNDEELLKVVFDVEKKACQVANIIAVCSMQDADKLVELYHINISKVYEIPNGVDTQTVKFVSKVERRKLKTRLHLNHLKIAIFIGSWHQPNIEAVEKIFDMAEKRPDIYFLVVGSVGHYFSDKSYPQNVGFTGVVDDEEKQLLLNISDFALNPMLSGSGTNLKMLDYLLSGLPVITTPVGARGLNLLQNSIIICELDKFVDYFDELLRFNTEKTSDFVRENYSWKRIGSKYLSLLKDKLNHKTKL